MDTFKRTLNVIFFILSCSSGSAFAVYPAGVQEGSYCHSNPGNTGTCHSGAKFQDVGGAALFACQKSAPAGAYGFTILKTDSHPRNGPAGLNGYGKFYYSYICSYSTNQGGYTEDNTASPGKVTAEPVCGGNSPVLSYAPASCTGSPAPITQPVACSATSGAMIPAYHPAPATSIGCYAGCSYTATSTNIVEYNGGSYESGSWTGNGSSCEPTDIALFGGSPGNSQHVNGGGITPGDLLNLASEATLQNVLSAIQSGITATNSNSSILEQIAASTATMAAGTGGATQPDDPDGLAAEYQNRLAAVQVDQNGKLPDSVLNAQTVDVGSTFSNVQGFIGASSCPVPPTFQMMGNTYTFDLAILCSLAQALSYLVVALASLAGAKIFIGGM